MPLIDVMPGLGPALGTPGVPALAWLSALGVAATGALVGVIVLEVRRRVRRP